MNRTDIQHVARLSRLSLTDPQADALLTQLESILGYVAQISEVDVDNVEPMTRVGQEGNVMRDDLVGPSLSLEQVLQNAPATDGPFFKVPKIIGGASEDSAG